ncbi:hypothetical protein CDAR_465401 [Caerostris darwini]|uniref:Uncharacterized protein n=1 Tax=Caerostris darwini TaxID=1538125 RepID=A0AAV4SE38_9ARAC|nr:hypothetical protein CDAR_465401 [Caerostris darwini]
MGERVTPRATPTTHIHFQNTTPPSIPKKEKKERKVIGRSFSKKNESFHSVGRTEICVFHSLAIHFKKCLFSFKMVGWIRHAKNVARKGIVKLAV